MSVHGLAGLRHGQTGRLGDLFHGGVIRKLTGGTADRPQMGMYKHGKAHGVRIDLYGPPTLLHNRRRGIGREAESACGIEVLGRTDEPKIALANEDFELHPMPDELLGDAHDQAQIRLDQRIACLVGRTKDSFARILALQLAFPALND
jgi:hypothetical protein